MKARLRLVLLPLSLVLTMLFLIAYVRPIRPYVPPVAQTGSIGGGSSAYGASLGRDKATNPANSFFPLGVYDDAHVFAGDASKFEAVIVDLKSRGFDFIMLTNASVERDVSLLDTTDYLDFNVVLGPGTDLWNQWWPDDVLGDEETANEVIGSVVQQLKFHSSLKGYMIADEPPLALQTKLSLATKAFKEADPSRSAMLALVGLDRIGPVFDAAQPDVMLIDAYPFGAKNTAGDFRMSGFGYGFLDFITYIRLVKLMKPPDVPLWIILQAHRFKMPGEPYALREPSPAEVRAEYWLAIGEGAKGVFWFVYSSQQGWRGLVDNPPLYQEVTLLTQRTLPLRALLLRLSQAADEFTVSGDSYPYVSTLTDGAKRYVVAVNRDSAQSQMLRIGSPIFAGSLRDLETGVSYPLDSAILFEPGDGRILELANLQDNRLSTR